MTRVNFKAVIALWRVPTPSPAGDGESFQKLWEQVSSSKTKAQSG